MTAWKTCILAMMQYKSLSLLTLIPHQHLVYDIASKDKHSEKTDLMVKKENLLTTPRVKQSADRTTCLIEHSVEFPNTSMDAC